MLLWMFLIMFLVTSASVLLKITALEFLVTNVTFDLLVIVSSMIRQTFLTITTFATNITNLEGLVVDLYPMYDKSSLTFKHSSR